MTLKHHYHLARVDLSCVMMIIVCSYDFNAYEAGIGDYISVGWIMGLLRCERLAYYYAYVVGNV
jgi:hypothetical protein